jgi:YVTN family beta-propeller protein
MNLFDFRKITSIVLSAVLVTTSLLFTSLSCTASAAARTHATPSAELAYVTNVQGDSISVINTETKKVIDTISVKENPDHIAVTPDGNKAYVSVWAGNTSAISVIDTRSRKVTDTIPLEELAYAIAITPDGSYAYVAGHGCVFIIDTKTNAVVNQITIGDYNYGITISPDGSQAYVAHLSNVSMIDTQNQTVVQTISVGSSFNFSDMIAFRPLSNEVYIAGFKVIKVINTTSGEVVSTIPISDRARPDGFVFAPDGTKAYVANFDEKSGLSEVIIIDTSSRSIIDSIRLDEDPTGIAITADGKQLYVGDFTYNRVWAINLQTRTRHTIPVKKSPYRIAIAPCPS